MGSGYKTLRLLTAVLLFGTIFAVRLASQYSPTRIKVLSADFHSLGNANPVPKNCDLTNFDAYCNESRNPTGENIMRVQDSDGKSFTITCSVDSRWSKCAPLQVGESYEAKRGKHGLTVWIQNPNGKESTRQYRLADDAPPEQSGPAANSQPVALPSPSGSLTIAHPLGAAPGQKAPAAAPAPATESTSAPTAPPMAPTAAPAAPAHPGQESVPGQVRCNFTSMPSGAEISIDGKYVGSTPSSISMSPGNHTVVFSMPGFAPWTRELSVAPGSDLTVNAILQKGKK